MNLFNSDHIQSIAQWEYKALDTFVIAHHTVELQNALRLVVVVRNLFDHLAIP
jgi:hypothetical protein